MGIDFLLVFASGKFTRKARYRDASAKRMAYGDHMHLQLPNTLILPTEAEIASKQEIRPGVKGEELDRLVLNRPGRKVKFYFRNNSYKRCYSDLSVEQVKSLFTALQSISKSGNLVFDDDVYLISPKTKRLVK
jgi:hypothetical protein